MTDRLVLIVGAGPTGLVLALWLTRLGVRVRIIDRTAEPGTTSRAVAVQARTLELYRQVDLSSAVVEGGVKVAAANLWVAGAKAARLPLGRMGEGLSPFPYALTYPQDAHERLLIERLSALGVNVERRTELVRFEQDPEKVRAVLKRPDGSEEICEAAYLAGCDGAHSTVREVLATAFPGGTYSGLFCVADVEAAGPAANGEIHVDFEEADFLAVFPLKGGNHLRLIGPVTWELDREHRELTFDDVGERAIRNLKLDDRQGELVLDLWGASPRGRAIPRGPRSCWGRGPRSQPGRRSGNEHRHRGRREPGLEARRRPQWPRRRQFIGDL